MRMIRRARVIQTALTAAALALVAAGIVAAGGYEERAVGTTLLADGAWPGATLFSPLDSGDTLLCHGPQGTFIEVSPAGDVVWRYVNPMTGNGAVAQGAASPTNVHTGPNAVFRADRYAFDGPALADRDVSPGDPLGSHGEPTSRRRRVQHRASGIIAAGGAGGGKRGCGRRSGSSQLPGEGSAVLEVASGRAVVGERGEPQRGVHRVLDLAHCVRSAHLGLDPARTHGIDEDSGSRQL